MTPTPSEVPVVAPTEVADLIRAGALLVDVRELNEWNAGRISMAELKPMTEINDWYTDLPRDGDIIFYCRTGQRSGQVVKALVEQAGFENVYNMTGGIVAWANEGLNVEEPIDG